MKNNILVYFLRGKVFSHPSLDMDNIAIKDLMLSVVFVKSNIVMDIFIELNEDSTPPPRLSIVD